MRVAVGLVAKAPVPGQVKTRLCPPFSPDQAAGLAAAMLTDTALTALGTGYEVLCVATGDQAVIRAALPCALPVLQQCGAGLAERLSNAQAGLFARGYDRVLLVGADCPTLDVAYLTAAEAALDDVDVVLGPAHDGGYTVIGTDRHLPALFQGVPMSTSRTAAVTAARCRATGLSLRTLAPRRDLDKVEDLGAAVAGGELRAAPSTRALLESLLGTLLHAP